MLKLFAALIVMLCGLLVSGQAFNYSIYAERSVKFTELVNGFSNPPEESRLRCYWWWLNSMVTRESITRDLEEMKDKGYGGASLFDAGSSNYSVAGKTAAGLVFMSDEWMELYKHAVREADRTGIELSVNVQSGWNPGAPSITPEFAMKKIVWAEVTICGGKRINIELPQPLMKLMYKDIMVQALPAKQDTLSRNDLIKNWKKKSFNEKIGWKGIYPLYELREDFPGDGRELAVKKEEILDLTGYFNNGILEWDAPEGNWTIIRHGYTCTGPEPLQTATDGRGCQSTT